MMLSTPSTFFENNDRVSLYTVLFDGWCSSVLLLAWHLDLRCGEASLRWQRGLTSRWWLLGSSKRKLYVDDPMLIPAGRGARKVSQKVGWVGGEISLRREREAKTWAAKRTASTTFYKKHMKSVKKQDKRAAR